MFERLFLMFFPYVQDTNNILSMIRKIEDLITERTAELDSNYRQSLMDADAAHRKQVHELLVVICLKDDVVLNYAADRKITAIKHLRMNTIGYSQASLKACKDAIEDERVQTASRSRNNIDTLRDKLMESTTVDEYHYGIEVDNNNGPRDCEQ